MRRVTASTAHEIPERPPLRVTVGEEVAVGVRDTEWPAFVFVTANASGGSGSFQARSGSHVDTLAGWLPDERPWKCLTTLAGQSGTDPTRQDAARRDLAEVLDDFRRSA